MSNITATRYDKSFGDSARWVGYAKLSADPDRGRIFDFAMAGQGARSLCSRVTIDGVLGSLAKEHAAMCFQMADQVLALQPFLPS
jgi:hypothetical protein